MTWKSSKGYETGSHERHDRAPPDARPKTTASVSDFAPRFRHNLVVLNQLTAAIGVLDDVLETTEYTDNNSVILMRDEETVSPSLNLSPFILDENALSGQQNSKLFFFTSYERNQINFTLIDNLKDTLNITRDNYPLVSELFDGFINKFQV